MKQTTQKHYPRETSQNFPVVGIGASAGGLDAFKKILKEIPVDSGMAYVIVQHLSPDHDSNLTEILAQITAIPVHEIINDINLAPDNIYIIPENSILTTQDGVLKLAPRDRYSKRSMPIDIFFKSLAEVHKSFSIGVVLSGTAFDGTNGLKEIKEVGGVTIAQDPESALFKGMPQSVIDADAADYILAPEKIPSQLLHIRNSYVANHAYVEEEQIPKDEEDILKQIIKLIYLRTGNDFNHYKQPTIRRRIARRMVITKKEELVDYFNLVRNDKTEQDALFNDMLIPVSYFFRDQKIFESLSEDIFPQLIQNVANKNLRVWVAGCSTGEEAYSLAISIYEYLSEKGREDIRVQIFASDISEKVITKARAAVYTPQDLQNVSEVRLHNYFTKTDGNYHISKVIRDMCVFAVHNFIKDPPFAKMDLVTCRNVLIYLDAFLQNKALATFHYALKDKGFLFLGKSETAASATNLFEPVAKHEKIYVRKFAPGRYVPQSFKPANPLLEKIVPVENKNPYETDFRKMASDIIFSHYTPAAVIINDHQDIIHFHGDTSPFLLPSPGKPNFNVLKMAREGIAFELRNLLLKVKNDREKIIKENITVKNQNYLATIEVVPLDNADNHLLVLFNKVSIPTPDKSANKGIDADQQRIKDLERELAQLREDIKRVTEEQQTAYEELQTTNEELLSSSEELQALNEELETSTEELQSNNEELVCVNDELMDRQDQLMSLRHYSDSIVRTIREPLIVLDKSLRIKSVNPAFYKYFRTTELETEGRSLFELGNKQWDVPELRALLEKVLPEKSNIVDYKITAVFPGIGERIILLNAARVLDAKPNELILLAVEDVTEVSLAYKVITDKNNELELYNEQLKSFSWAASHDLQEPLRKIYMFSKLILEEEKNLTEKGQYNLERITRSVANMQQLIDDLMGYTSTIAIEKNFKVTDLNTLVKKTITGIKELIKETGTEIVVTSLPHTVSVLPQQFQQLFTNLIVNSIRYAKEDQSPHIKIQEDVVTKEEIIALGGDPDIKYFKILVSDNGIGFNQASAERIFDAFFRLHSKDKYRGSGLGLTLCRKIMENHNGFIKAESKENEGTVMHIYLPDIKTKTK